MIPVVAIVGRPNVGKSTLFNRISGERKALVNDTPGVTRDRLYNRVTWNQRPFIIVDTGGVEPTSRDPLLVQMRHQTELAVQEADVIIFLLDASQGLTPADLETARFLRQTGKPVFHVVNKVDGPSRDAAVIEFYKLGAERLYPISAIHGTGVWELLDDLIARLPTQGSAREVDGAGGIRIAIVGRPNVGKSSLINRLCGKERTLVTPMPGTTTDPVDTQVKWYGKTFTLIDTAGIRRKSKTYIPLERLSVLKALRSLERCDVALLMLDAIEGPTDQDAAIGEQVVEAGKGCVILVNKWDLVEKGPNTHEEYVRGVRERLPHLDFAPVITISALTGLRVGRILPEVEKVFGACGLRISTSALNKKLREWIEAVPPPIHGGRRVKIYYMTQVSVHPPTFVGFTNQPDAVSPSYKRYIVRKLREEFDFSGATIRLLFRLRERE